MASTGVLIASTLASGGFALLGVGFSNGLANRRERRNYRRETAMELADTERAIWQDDWIELNVQLERLDARLASAGVTPALFNALRDLSILCWRDRHHMQQVHGGDPDLAGISNELLEARRLVARACVTQLLSSPGRKRRDALREEALEQAEHVLADAAYDHLRN